MRNDPTLYLLGLLLALLPGCTQAAVPGRSINVTMKKFAISPGEIRIKQGETVRFEVVTEDVQHGFAVRALGINEAVNPGKPAHFVYTARQKGTFTIECGIICGFGHDEMHARLIVE
ncbi:MAG TPA: cupredoxin domain-containing protein [Terriglobales bacterium]|nr:cupredoxin domain-containing protein [Terriglobales bacterium]